MVRIGAHIGIARPEALVAAAVLAILTIPPSVRPIDALPATPAPFPSSTDAALRRAPFPGPYEAKFVRAVDGDTFEARMRVWFGQEIDTLVRVRGIDAPELKAKCAREARLAAEARDLLADFLAAGPIRLRDVAADKYFGRIVASVEIGASEHETDDVALLMTASNLARPYDGRKRAPWCAARKASD